MTSTEYMREYRDKNRLKFREYNRIYNQKWRKENGYHNEENSKLRYPEKVQARSILRRSIIKGEIVRLPCEVCGEVKSQGHHEDYTRPLEVKWLCTVHHKERHKVINK